MSSKCCSAVAEAQVAALPIEHFRKMIPNCLEYAQAEHASGRPIVGMLCEFTPRELIMAAGAVPVLLCGGSAATIPAAEEDLPANLCPLIKSTYGYHVKQSNPFLEMASLIVAETTCDGKKKMYELMGETRPMHILELPQKRDDPDALEHWIREVRKLQTALERRFNVLTTHDRINEAIATMNRERYLRRSLAELMKADVPPLSGRELMAYRSSISAIPADLAHYEAALEYYRAKGPDERLKDRVRVLLTGVPIVQGAEKVVNIIEDNGGLVVCAENCTGLKPLLEEVPHDGDPVRALAEKYFHLPCSVMTRNRLRIDTLRELAREYRAQCIVDLVWQACITYDVESHFVKRLAEEELGLPYLRVETDYSPSDVARIAVRVEALFETARA